MTTNIVGIFLVGGILWASKGVFAENTSQDIGEEKFKALCEMCHPDGGTSSAQRKLSIKWTDNQTT